MTCSLVDEVIFYVKQIVSFPIRLTTVFVSVPFKELVFALKYVVDNLTEDSFSNIRCNFVDLIYDRVRVDQVHNVSFPSAILITSRKSGNRHIPRLAGKAAHAISGSLLAVVAVVANLVHLSRCDD
ncbi:hypothetical protein PHYBLDRAFT_69211 [Phycomyces blakesleeanus NRRL 1555(-)]|uniref:Uncharacterized protein n=1 Tax=Phycomyces blakesleeanus (strain ATCC 8743b / DSM 1359 / FGSC 10004 / NBRC 33097 / NRRL 1555) TaxID=763407 RepID=A0A167KHW2_PHYB8|nr:hypothetical protein PHYBLDRAFT_69211 [Phycomyces blakesleeanus NRRL 1555(-)]OAD68137.1 hypothetical protein PHYBLDRAFT_69211 [Phycomyces blakesleeanus NRRL 1555(-)]|eukprot:XP_018286177.1 hypothetical protein PHYBLDRAFT_69211 [Phycomyces blakesleeanus NRRL 1555(-)]